MPVEGSLYNAQTGKTTSWNSASIGNNHYADVNGNVYHNDGGGWNQHSSSGWSKASGDTSWADSASQARSSGEDRWGGFSGADHSWGGGGFGGGGFGGAGSAAVASAAAASEGVSAGSAADARSSIMLTDRTGTPVLTPQMFGVLR